MSGQFTSLSANSLREIIAHLDESIRLMDVGERHTLSEIKIKSMLVALRRQLQEYLALQHQFTGSTNSYPPHP